MTFDRHENALESNMFEALFEFAPQANVLLDEPGRIVLANAQAKVLFGYGLEELQQQPITLLIPSYLSRSYVNSLPINPTNAPHSEPASLALQGRHKDGNEFPIEISFRFLSLEHVPHTLITVIDIDKHRHVGAEAIETYHRLLDREAVNRRQIAQKLHNGPLQELQGLTFALTALVHLPEIQAEVGSELSQIRTVVQQVARQLRGLEDEFSPPTLTTFGLAAAIRSRVNALQNHYPTLKIQLDLAEDDERLSPLVRTALFSAFEQAIANVIQHAGAQQVQIRLILDSTFVELAIIDDGCGFEVPPHWITMVREKCLGLAIIRERAEAIGGSCWCASMPGQGTTLRVVAPVVFYA